MAKKTFVNDSDLKHLLTTINNQLEEDKEINLINVQDFKSKPISEFVLLFAEALLATLFEYNLTLTDVKVILKIIIYAQYGNLINMSHQQLADDLNLKRQAVTRSIKNLKESNILIDIGKNTYLNPQVIAKGKIRDFEREKSIEKLNENLAEIGAKKLAEINIPPSFLTKNMKKNIRQKRMEFTPEYGGNFSDDDDN